MSWLDTILRRKAPSTGGLSVATDFTTSHNFEAVNTWQACKKLYQDNSVIQGCALAYQTMMPEAPLRVHDARTGKVIDTHGLYDVFDASNLTALLSTTMLHIIIGGEAYWYKRRSGSRVTSFTPLSKEYITPQTNEFGDVIAYRFFVSGKAQYLPVEDIITIRGFWLDPSKHWLGASPVQLCSIAAQTYNEATRAVYSIHRNDAVPKTVIVYDEELTEEQQEAARHAFARRHSGSNRGTTAHLWGVKSIQRLGLGWQELGMDATFMQLATRICSTMRVHPIVAYDYAGLMKATYNNFGQAIKDFTVNTRIPLYRILEDHITAGIKDMYPNVYVRFDESTLEILQPERKDELQSTIAAYQAGIITQVEARNVFGYEAITATTPVTTGVEGDIKARMKSLQEGDSDELYHKSLDDYLQPYDDALATRLGELITKLGKAVVSGLNKKADEVDWSAWEDKFVSGTQRQRNNLVSAAIERAVNDGGGNVNDGEAYFEAAQQGAAELSSDKIRPSVGTIREAVQGLVIEHMDKTPKEVAALLEAKFKTLSESRANAIARTTSTAVNGFTQKAVWSEMNDTLPEERRIVRQWVAMGGNTRDAHEAANGQLEDELGLFTVGGEQTDYPCGSGLSAKNSVNCRCFTRARRKGELV